MSDPNMELALRFAQRLGPAEQLPEPLSTVDARSTMLLSINGGLSQDPYITLSGIEGLLVPLNSFLVVAERIRDLAAHTTVLMPGLDPLQRVNVALRLWAGC